MGKCELTERRFKKNNSIHLLHIISLGSISREKGGFE
jgi:hypothetical protein